tara:strand:- start:235 stop:957 length:723 start_codon:yes stop_codon:yes gene_type:complete
MEINEYRNIFELEKNHWWYKAMRRISFSLLDKYIKSRNLKVLDAGCGTGFNMLKLKKYGEIFGIDNSPEAIKFCKKRGLSKASLGSVEKLNFKDNSFDLLTSFEVIYHRAVKSDVNALKEFYRVLRKKGYLLLRVPAFDFLYSSHDKMVHTARRYTEKDLREKLEKVGFKVEKISYVNFFLFPLVYFVRFLTKNTKESDIQEVNPFLNKFLLSLLSFESLLVKNVGLPFGVSVIVLARKV